MGIKAKITAMPVEAKASAAYTACSVLQKGIAVVTLPIFTRLLTTQQFGEASIYTAWVAFFSIALSLNLPYGSLNAAMASFPDERDEYVASIEGIFIALSCVFLAVYLPFVDWWNSWLGLPTPMVLIMVAEVFSTACLQCWMSKNRYEFRYWSVVVVTIVMAVLSPLLSIVLVLLVDEKGYAKVVGNAAVMVAFGLVVGILAFKKGGAPYNRRFWRYALSFNIPLLAYYLAQVAFNQSDRIIIGVLCGDSQAGMYTVAYTLGMLLSFLADAIGASYVPWFYERLGEGEERRDRPVAMLLSLTLAILLLCVVALAPELILVFAGEAYAEAAYVVPPVALCVLLLFYARLFDRVLFYWRKRLALVVGAVVAGAVNVALNFLLIPVWGYLAAGWTTLASYVLFTCTDWLFARHTMKLNGHDENMWNIGGLGALAAIALMCSIGLMLLYPWPIARIVAAFGLAAICIALRSKVKALLTAIKEK